MQLVYSSKSGSKTAAGLYGKITMLAETGTLVAATMRFSYETSYTPVGTSAMGFGLIQIASLQSPTPWPLFLLASGYMGMSMPVGWTGRIPLSQSIAVTAELFESYYSYDFLLTLGTEID